MIEEQPSLSPSFGTALEVRAGKTANRFAVTVYSLTLIVLPWVGWLGFGPGTPGDTMVNGNSIVAYWLMRIALLCCWLATAIYLKRTLDLLRHLPILFTLDEVGIKDRNWIETPWTEIEDVYYINGDLHLQVRRSFAKKNIVFKLEELGFTALDKIESYIKRHTPHQVTTLI